MADDIFNAGQEDKEIIKLRTDEASREKQRRINYGLTFSTKEGFDVLMDIMAGCHANSISYIQGDTHETAFREGERNVFLYILSNLSGEMKQKISIGGA